MTDPKTRWENACLEAAELVHNRGFEVVGELVVGEGEKLRRLAHELKGWACVQCGEPVEPGRRPPAYGAPTCHACLPPPKTLPSARTHWPWDIDIDTTKIALERCMRAVILTSSKITDSAPPYRDLGRGVTALLRVQIPCGQHDRFRELAQPIVMKPPPQPQVGVRTPPDDGHPGDQNDGMGPSQP